MNAITPIPRPYLTEQEVADRFNVSTATIRRWIREGAFPRGLRIGTGTTRWRLSDIEAYEASLTWALCTMPMDVALDFGAAQTEV
ncbi:helix-turn-helix transcriptional regulator [Stagnihabitans tardus]|uniref:Helix-turn-helix domain-containing protein n=1 Tax=Stagnihabitans tardus TaxID=2699202 RepID=A0AAE5BU86_9RHOB|nr:helix-turn-helix domain-containing protein [Stagnihabitans tardus]NBZ87576.1 helix-turn-helix domain-containing protein [Stagnihabitans tardus]